MAQDQPPSDESPEFTPERWELAIEDAAELVAILLERGQNLTDALRDLSKQRPLLMACILAVGVGAIGGALFATSGRRRSRRANIVAEASAVAEAASQRLTHQTEAMRTFRRGWMRNGVAGAAPRRIAETGRNAQELMRLLPIVVAVLKNPLVRRYVWQYARKALR